MDKSDKQLVVTFPDIGEGVVEGEVVLWLKKEGEAVAVDEPVVVVMTDKATVELPSPVAGILAKQHYQPGQIALKDHPLYTIDTEKVQKQVLATPATRHLAKEMGVDINQVQGSGKEGRVLPQDFQKPSTSSKKPLIGIQRLMAEKMTESKRTIPHFSYMEEADATYLLKLQEKSEQEGAKEGIRVTLTPFFIKALSLTASQFPILNSSYDEKEGALHFYKSHNIGIAMSTPLGLIVPVLKSVEALSLKEVILLYEALKDKAIHNKLSPKDMQEGTLTLSNLGGLSGKGIFATPIINPPEVAILALAKVRKAPVVRNDAIVIRDILSLSWSFDHRFIDGHLAAAISHQFVECIQNPATLI